MLKEDKKEGESLHKEGKGKKIRIKTLKERREERDSNKIKRMMKAGRKGSKSKVLKQ